ncbi:MAG: exodeoxyribonuclease VII large subunit, partial [Pyramidobacter sp.]
SSADRPLSVDEVVARVRRLIEYDEVLAHISVEGELTDLKRHVSGHVYFSLKGQSASMNCVMFRSDAQGLLLWPRTGDRVLVTGAVRLYEARGTVQIYARKMFPLGQGAAARAKEELRRKLESEGLFASGRKRPIPRCPRVVACVTSDTGAAVRDVIRQHDSRFPAAQLIVVPSLVQGVHAAESAVAALRRAGALPGVEVVLLVRGGGAKEDLNPFDDEELVREVARCPVPVVTGIGHEIDESLCDLAADLRQPTPTAAAAAVFPDRLVELAALEAASGRMSGGLRRTLESCETFLRNCRNSMDGVAKRRLEEAVQHLDGVDERLEKDAAAAVAESKTGLAGIERALANLSPERLARRGYSLVQVEGKPLTSAAKATVGAELTVQLLDGDVCGTVNRVSCR